MKKMKNIFVTVGTTKFPKLIETITKLDVLLALKELGSSNIQIQTGRDFKGINLDSSVRHAVVNRKQSCIVKLLDLNITVRYDEYFENFKDEIKKADLVISHAGAGSCLDVLQLNKPLLVVVNEELMDNHQMELALQLQKDGHLYFCVCHSLASALFSDFSALKPYAKPDEKVFSNYLDKCCGFV